MKRFSVVASILLSALAVGSLPLKTIAQEKPKIQIAILLDSSNSMDGLIDQTRQQIWTVVNALTAVRKEGQVPELEIALYHYGNDALPPTEGFNRQLTDFTPELDAVSEQLFQIHTNGGQEYAGWVIRSALSQLGWSSDPQDFKAIFIAGNEPFDQGQVPWQKAIELAQQSDVLVNTIYCGEAENPERDLWAQGAALAAGANFNIDQDLAVAFVPSPFDDRITQLNQALNDTYIPFGETGTQGLQRQLVQDANAGQQIVTRGASKSSGYYNNASWDLIDALAEESVSLETMAEEELPENLRGLSLADKEVFVEEQRAQRQAIQTEIRDLTAQRQAYLDRSPQQSEPRDTLDDVMIQALRQQLAEKGFILR